MEMKKKLKWSYVIAVAGLLTLPLFQNCGGADSAPSNPVTASNPNNPSNLYTTCLPYDPVTQQVGPCASVEADSSNICPLGTLKVTSAAAICRQTYAIL